MTTTMTTVTTTGSTTRATTRTTPVSAATLPSDDELTAAVYPAKLLVDHDHRVVGSATEPRNERTANLARPGSIGSVPLRASGVTQIWSGGEAKARIFATISANFVRIGGPSLKYRDGVASHSASRATSAPGPLRGPAGRQDEALAVPSREDEDDNIGVEGRHNTRSRSRRPTAGETVKLQTRPPSTSVNPRIARRRAQVLNTVTSRERRRRLFALTTAVLIACAFAMVFSPMLSVDSVDIVGATDTARVSEASGVKIGAPMIGVSTSRIRQRLLALPDIAKARVSKHWFRRISIAVVSEPAVALIVGPTKTAVIGANGVVVATVPSTPLDGYNNLIRIEGVAPAAVGRGLLGEALQMAQTAAALGPLARESATILEMQDGRITLFLRHDDATNRVSSNRVSSNRASSNRADASASGDDSLEVRFGTAEDVDLKARALEALIAGTSLDGFTTVDLGVPDAPILGH